MMREVKPLRDIKISETELLNFLLNYACGNRYALAAWSLPEEDMVQVILSKEPTHLKRDAIIEDLPMGYLFAPFDRQKDSLFLQADFSFCLKEGALALPSTDFEIKSTEWLLENFPRQEKKPGPVKAYYLDKQVTEFDREHYLHVAEEAVKEVEVGTFEKVVPSRSKTVDLSANFSLTDAFLKLWKAYPDAFVSLTTSPESGTWIGASPEELVRVFDKTIFKTVALAGTQVYEEGQNLRHVSWTQKEIEEQALVERYIISCFKKIRLREYEEHGPKTVVAGNVMHLRSDFTVNLKETNFPQLGSVMLQLLHPTSAVCGMPLEPSLEFLKKHEGYDRGFYSGYLGPVNMNNQINVFVNLRCMQLENGKAIVYAGAGITIDSIPLKEWEETEMKMNTLLSVIQ